MWSSRVGFYNCVLRTQKGVVYIVEIECIYESIVKDFLEAVKLFIVLIRELSYVLTNIYCKILMKIWMQVQKRTPPPIWGDLEVGIF